MSGLLRRIKRSRPADAGEPLPEGQAAAPEGAAPTTEPATAVTEPVAPGAQPEPDAQPQPDPQPEPKTEAPVLLADPNTPAGIDPAAAPLQPPAGRRGRLRRRLRYLRRARELMLRDLGGLLYEVHRTGGGNVEAHGTIVRAKVQRIAGLDAEAHALETALATTRPEAVVFQPGIGGACPACGEYYGSAARFCSNCGAPLGVAAPAPDLAPATPAPATRESVFGRPSQPTQHLSSGDPLRPSAPATDQPTAALGAAAAGPAAAGEDTAVLAPASAAESSEGAQETGAREEAAGGGSGASGEAAAVAPGASDEPAAADTAASDESAAAEAGASDDPAASDQPAMSDDPAAVDARTETDEPAPSEPGASDDPAADDTAVHDQPATGDDAATDEPALSEPGASDESGAGEQPAATGAAPVDEAPASEKSGEGSQAAAPDAPEDARRNPFAALRNGRTEEDHAPPELSSGDPLSTRDRRP